MRFRYVPGVLFTAGILLLLVVSVWLWTAQPANAQCGSQASSCKNCHEVQGQKPVNSDGTAWHTSHAFGDFCYICHAGNNQAKDIDGAHAGMVPPLSDVKASCQQCHPGDLQERAQVYATALGVEVGSGSPDAPGGAAAEPAVSALAAQPVAVAPATTELDVDDPNLVNYTQRYDEIVLGKHPTNWGNLILLAMIGLVTVGGGGFVISNEKLVRVSFGNTQKPTGELPSDIVDMLPSLEKLKLHSRKALQNVLAHPQKAEKVLSLMDAVISEQAGEEKQSEMDPELHP